MRPKKLVMSAFGPYAGLMPIDFDKLGVNGLYLVTGDTGAGKTIIFDAISFALFGATSNSRRSVHSLRSLYAKPETRTFVELTFEYRGQEYFIRRVPQYDRPKERGTGTTTEKACVELRMPGRETPITKDGEVSKAITDLLGVDQKQFAQICMIAQGEFLKLVDASPKDRQAIFQKIFKTQRFYNLQKALQRDCAEKETRMKSLVDQMRSTLSDVTLPDGTKLPEGLLSQDRVSEALTTTQAAIDADTASAAEMQGRIAAIDAELTELDAKCKQAEEGEALRRKLAETIQSIAAAQQQAETLRERAAAADAKKPEADQLSGEIAKAEEKLPQYEQLDEKRRAKADLESRVKQDAAAVETGTADLGRRSKVLEAGKAERDSLAKAGEQLAKLQAQSDRADERAKRLQTLENAYSDYSSACFEAKKKQNDYLLARNDYDKLAASYQQLHSAFLNGQAGIIARDLQEGQPCPVCGAIHHPTPAVCQEGVPSEDKVKSAETAMQRANKTMESASRDAGSAQSKAEERKESLVKSMAETVPEATLDTLADALKAAKQAVAAEKIQLNKEIGTAKHNAERYEDLNRKIPAAEKQLAERQTAQQELELKLAREREQLTALTNETAEMERGLPCKSKAEAESRIRTMKSNRDAILKAADTALKAVQEEEKAISALQGTEKSLKEQVEKLPVIDLAAVRTQDDLKRTEKQQLGLRRDAVNSRISINSSAVEHVNRFRQELEQAERAYRIAETVSNTAGGKVNGKSKMSLETYVQAAYFDRILQRANTRLSRMTNGQYELKRGELTGAASEKGLELNVKDYYNDCTERDASSLSGGESFMASLSLALGLSEEVQASAGGIRLDTMFIDEGFGTLDHEALTQAVNALLDLSENGNRLVGIISHVDELQERIPNQIVVKKGKINGSTAEVVNRNIDTKQ